jgi:hypothetical protein
MFNSEVIGSDVRLRRSHRPEQFADLDAVKASAAP